MPLQVSNTSAHHQEVKIALHSLWCHHNETNEWSKITKIQFYKYEHTVVKFNGLGMWHVWVRRGWGIGSWWGTGRKETTGET